MGSEKPRVCLRNQGDDVVALLGGHALHVGEKQACGQTDSQNTLPRAVTDYPRGEPMLNQFCVLLLSSSSHVPKRWQQGRNALDFLSQLLRGNLVAQRCGVLSR